MTPDRKTLWDKHPDMVVHEVEPYNAEPSAAALAEQPITPIDVFYSRNHGPVPDIDAGSWRLRVAGLVREQLEVSLDDLRNRFAERTVVATLQCAGNRRSGLMAVRDIPGQHPWRSGATSTAEWTGVWLADVLSAAGALPTARHVAFEAPDIAAESEPPAPYGGSIPISKALYGDVLLAWGMNGSPLTPLHGAPLRVVVPGYIGARSVKWLGRVTVQRDPSDNYFQATAYRLMPPEPALADDGESRPTIALGPAALNSAILQPDDGASVAAGATTVTGYAYVGDGRAVVRVDVSLDGGAHWQEADLDEQAGPWTWQHWRATIQLPLGETEIVARAWDTSAATQPADPLHVWNPKGYVNTSWARARVTAD